MPLAQALSSSPADCRPRLAAMNARLARIEAGLAGLMLAAVLLISCAGAVARSLGTPLIWADEAAVAAMVWSGFLGAAALFGRRGHMALTFLPERLGRRGTAALRVLADALLLTGFAGLGLVVWRWFDLPGLRAAGSAQALADASFNFLYLEPTQTLGIRKIWIWLVLPLFTLGGTLHAALLLAMDLRGETPQ
ncbi:TRAP transporter small permease [Salipiger sp. CCB-MM3]|uniref:TRAP transporter small permease n=1 Tax=Salipiger sp. CCB-MM3 TaxID=1792508 RepID=UPI00082542B1|nr:TRAP transporter small permease subunit [Salipiger sp. CCB-MM3]